MKQMKIMFRNVIANLLLLFLHYVNKITQKFALNRKTLPLSYLPNIK